MPLNMIACLIQPFLCFSDKTNKIINNITALVIYLPFGCVFTIGFILLNAICIPFSYLTMLAKLMFEVFNQSKFTAPNTIKRLIVLVVFFFIGLFILILAFLIECLTFFGNLFIQPRSKELDPNLNSNVYIKKRLSVNALYEMNEVCEIFITE